MSKVCKNKARRTPTKQSAAIKASDLAELTLLACAVRRNAREMQGMVERYYRIADMLDANRARLKLQTDLP